MISFHSGIPKLRKTKIKSRCEIMAVSKQPYSNYTHTSWNCPMTSKGPCLLLRNRCTATHMSAGRQVSLCLGWPRSVSEGWLQSCFLSSSFPLLCLWKSRWWPKFLPPNLAWPWLLETSGEGTSGWKISLCALLLLCHSEYQINTLLKKTKKSL